MTRRFEYRWSNLIKEILISLAVALAIVFFGKIQGALEFIVIIVVTLYRLVVGIFPLCSVTIDNTTLVIRRLWLFTPDIEIKTSGIIDYKQINTGSKVKLLNGCHIVTESGDKHFLCGDGICDFAELDSLLASRYSVKHTDEIGENAK